MRVAAHTTSLALLTRLISSESPLLLVDWLLHGQRLAVTSFPRPNDLWSNYSVIWHGLRMLFLTPALAMFDILPIDCHHSLKLSLWRVEYLERSRHSE